MSKSILENFPRYEQVLEMDTEELAAYLLEHLHAVSTENHLSQGNSLPSNLANHLSHHYPVPYRERITENIVAACNWLINKDYLEIINQQRFYRISKKGNAIKTADDLQAVLNSAKGKSVSGNLHLDRFKKVYQAVEGSKRKIVNLLDVLKDEGLSQAEIDNEVEYMEGEGWVERIGDNGPPFIRLTHQGIKAASSQTHTEISETRTWIERESEQASSLDIFISHSSQDTKIAEALIDLLQVALKSPAIRCTSVDGYKLPLGADVNEQLRQEILGATVFIGIITPTSLTSPYVLFELGARWGANRGLLPVLAFSDKSILREPLKMINAGCLCIAADVHDLIAEVADQLARETNKAATYEKHINRLVNTSTSKSREQITEVMTAAKVNKVAFPTTPVLEEGSSSAVPTPGTRSNQDDPFLIRTISLPSSSNISQVATQWLREFLRPLVNLLDEIKNEFGQNNFSVSASPVLTYSTAFIYEIDFFKGKRWKGLLSSDVGEHFLTKSTLTQEALMLFRKKLDEADQAFSALIKALEESPLLLKVLIDICERVVSRHHILRGDYEHSDLIRIATLLLGELHLEMSHFPTEAKDNLVRFIAYSLLELNVEFPIHSMPDDRQKLPNISSDISNELKGKDDSISEYIEETKRLFSIIKNESLILHAQLKKAQRELVDQYGATF